MRSPTDRWPWSISSAEILLIEAIDRKLARGEESRSAVVRRILEEALRAIEQEEEVERYARSYRENPQTEEEFGWSDQVAEERLRELPWK